MQKPNEVSRLGRSLRIFLIAGSTVFLGQAQDPQTTNSNRTVGPQKDGSVVASDNQTLTPAGKIIELGSPVRAKAIALNPNVKTNSGAVLLMGSPQTDYRIQYRTGQVLQRFIPAFMRGTDSVTSKAGSFTGITYSTDGQKPVLQPGRQPRRHSQCGPADGSFDKRPERGTTRSAGRWPALS